MKNTMWFVKEFGVGIVLMLMIAVLYMGFISSLALSIGEYQKEKDVECKELATQCDQGQRSACLKITGGCK